MSKRLLNWRDAVFGRDADVLIACGFESVLCDRDATPDREAIRALRRVSELRGVHVALLSHRPLSDLAWRCRDAPGVWLIAEGGRTVRDPHGLQVVVRRRFRAPGPQVHGLRAVLDRLPRAAAVLLAVDERTDLSAIATAHARPTGVALHVATPARPTATLAEGVVQGRAAWFELLDRVHGALLRHRERPSASRGPGMHVDHSMSSN